MVSQRQHKHQHVVKFQLLQTIHHPCIVGYHDSFKCEDELCIVMEDCAGGDLGQVISTHRESNTPFKESQILEWFVQSLHALSYLHSKRILHRDIKTKKHFFWMLVARLS